MKFTCETALLNKAIQSVLPAITVKREEPIFSSIHLIVKNNILRLEAMDPNQAISKEIPADVNENGEILIEATRFSSMVRQLAGKFVSFTKKDNENTVRMQSDMTDYKILLRTDEYPKFPSFDPNTTFVLKDEILKELIDKTIFACSKENTRPLFTGVLCEIEPGKITFVGTNTHRLAIKSKTIDMDKNMSIVIPSDVLKELKKNMDEKLPQDVYFSILNKQLMIKIDTWCIVSHLLEGNFPEYKRVIPKTFKVKTTVDKKQLAGAVSRMSLCSGTENDYSIVKINIDQEKMTIMSSSPDVGTGEEEIPCTTEGETLNVAFNAAYILEIMQNISTEKASLNLNSSLHPVMITPDSDEDYTYIVTPVRVIF